ncbi:cysteine hydrolase [Vagococcus humatus]|uniref:Cysteine hydrolase n=2 Tax=Vagococcus humatus TaxID=1889241 RepID=A0A3S0ADW9_9ENTE|nr:cysteine hydrolase [Vagococcus humatus]
MYKQALIVIDLLYDFVNPNGAVYHENNEKLLPKVSQLITQAREEDTLIIFMRHSHRAGKYDPKTLTGRKNCLEGTGGDELAPSLPVDEAKDYILKKRRYSSFVGTDLDLILREHDIKKVLICGTKTNNCVRSTVEDAYHLGYDTVVVGDCVATDKPEVNEIYLYDINRYYGQVISSEELFN